MLVVASSMSFSIRIKIIYVASGQTGSGKTFTMMGTPESPGIIPFAFKHIFAGLPGKLCNSAESLREASGKRFAVKASYVQIYNNEVYF